MKVIESGQSQPTLDEVIGQATEEPLRAAQPDGPVFILSQVDDLDVEVEMPKNRGFMAFLRGRSQEQATISLQDFEEELDLNPRSTWSLGWPGRNERPRADLDNKVLLIQLQLGWDVGRLQVPNWPTGAGLAFQSPPASVSTSARDIPTRRRRPVVRSPAPQRPLQPTPIPDAERQPGRVEVLTAVPDCAVRWSIHDEVRVNSTTLVAKFQYPRILIPVRQSLQLLLGKLVGRLREWEWPDRSRPNVSSGSSP